MIKYTKLWDRIRNSIEKVNNKLVKYGKDFTKIKFDSDNDLPLNKQLKFPTMTVLVRSVFEEDGKFHPEIYLDECLCVL